MAIKESSIEDELSALKDILLEVFTSSSEILEEFARVWERIGFSESHRKTRRETVALHISNLLKDIVQEEVQLEKTMINSLQSNEKELVSLCEQLSVPMEKMSNELSLYEREKTARTRVDTLNKIKFDRQKRLKRIREMETSLCIELDEKSQLNDKAHLPTEEELKLYLQRVENLEQTLNQRKKRHYTVKRKVQEACTHLEMELAKEFSLLLDKKDFIYSTANMASLEKTFEKFEEYVHGLEKTANELRQAVNSLWVRLEVPEEEQEKISNVAESFRPKDIQVLRGELDRLNELKNKHMEVFITKTRAELEKIWKDCLYGVQQKREFSPAFVTGPFDDDLLSAHESELDRMRGFYNDNQDIFNLILKRETMFKQYCELELKENDPARFSNRGGQLLKDQALRKQLKKDLPRVEKELNTVLTQWEEDHERLFMVHDSHYLDTIKMQWNEREASKCNEKIKRQKAKETTTLLEMTYGSKPSTPVKKIKKRAAASPLAATAPAKVRKVQQSPLVRPTTCMGSRLPCGNKYKNAKTPSRPPLQRRAQERRRILGEKNIIATDESFLSSHNFSLASTGSYSDFQNGMQQNAEQQQNCRSSVLCPKTENVSS